MSFILALLLTPVAGVFAGIGLAKLNVAGWRALFPGILVAILIALQQELPAEARIGMALGFLLGLLLSQTDTASSPIAQT
ncbi:MAG: hypothetical protein DLM70_06045 [Chloroflexi bacterium]|nr:MAG: hypothetical protein DLM70_06045 [Chloroflexota bacterium]